MKKFVQIFFIVIAVTGYKLVAQSIKTDINSFLAHKKLMNGTALVPDSTINEAEFVKQYAANKKLWNTALDYLTKTDLEKLAPGKYAIIPDSSVYAIVTDGPTRAVTQGLWESHRKYIDVQCVVHGAEQMQRAPLSAVTVAKPYNPVIDLANYTGEAPLHYAPAGRIFIFFPTDAHHPSVKADGFDKDKKIVIKVLAAN